MPAPAHEASDRTSRVAPRVVASSAESKTSTAATTSKTCSIALDVPPFTPAIRLAGIAGQAKRGAATTNRGGGGGSAQPQLGKRSRIDVDESLLALQDNLTGNLDDIFQRPRAANRGRRNPLPREAP